MDMDIYFKSDKEKKLFNSQDMLKRKYGKDAANKIRRRLDDLYAADNLEDMSSFPGRTHELSADHDGNCSIRIDKKLRLIFAPYQNPIPIKADGGIDRTQITSIIIIGVENYHD